MGPLKRKRPSAKNAILALQQKVWLIKKHGFYKGMDIPKDMPDPLLSPTHQKLQGTIGVIHRTDALRRKWKRGKTRYQRNDELLYDMLDGIIKAEKEFWVIYDSPNELPRYSARRFIVVNSGTFTPTEEALSSVSLRSIREQLEYKGLDPIPREEHWDSNIMEAWL